jgi:bifunctional DNase/RNase
MIEVYVSRLGMDAASNSYVLILQERDGYRVLPIWIGQPEAESIIIEMNDVERERPLTHDLCRRIIVGLGATVERVNISRVQNNTYYAELLLRRGEEVIEVDARPSDSIAIALRFSAPIFAHDSLLSHGLQVHSQLMTDPAVDVPPKLETDAIGETDSVRRLSAEQLKEHLESLRPEDFGKFSL